jgi:hypothetical protein
MIRWMILLTKSADISRIWAPMHQFSRRS